MWIESEASNRINAGGRTQHSDKLMLLAHGCCVKATAYVSMLAPG